MNIKQIIKDSIITLIFITICLLISFVLVNNMIRIENIIMIFLIGVLLIITITKNYIWGIIGILLSVITFNYFFADPIFSLEIYDPNYITTIIIFLIVSFITSYLVIKMQKHARILKYNEQQTIALYNISKNYINLSGIKNIILYHINSLYEYQNIITIIYYYNKEKDKLDCYKNDDIMNKKKGNDGLAKWCYDHNCECGHGTNFYEQSKWTFRPILCNNVVLGVSGILYTSNSNANHDIFITTLISQMAMAIERELLYTREESNRIEIEKEKLRNNLLRSISHDLRTPLTGIAGSSSLIVEQFDTLPADIIYDLVKNISDDSLWLNQLIDNLLNMTRIQDGKLCIKKEKEVVDDVIYEAIRRCERRKGNHNIQVHVPETLIFVEMDGQLIIQVLINLIDNAIKHTPNSSTIDVRCFINDDKINFEVSDNGLGVKESIKNHIFESFVTTKNEQGDGARGIGLGLSICKAIIEAHGGTINSYNLEDNKGAVFTFSLPFQKSQGGNYE